MGHAVAKPVEGNPVNVWMLFLDRGDQSRRDMDQRSQDGVAAVGFDGIGGEKIDTLAKECLQMVGKMHEAKPNRPAECHQQINIALGCLFVTGIGAKQRQAGHMKFLGQVIKMFVQHGHHFAASRWVMGV